TFAKEQPVRAVAIIGEFKPGKQERPAGYALVGIGKSAYPDGELHRMILELDERGFNSKEFRINVARALEERVWTRAGLPESITKLLERWLSEPWADNDQLNLLNSQKADGDPASVLWGIGGLFALPYSKCHLLHVLTYGYLYRTPPGTGLWM